MKLNILSFSVWEMKLNGGCMLAGLELGCLGNYLENRFSVSERYFLYS